MSVTPDNADISERAATSEAAYAPPASRPPVRRQSSRRGWTASAVLLVLIIGGIAVLAASPNSAGRQLWTGLTAGSQVSSIQQVIQLANCERAQALANNDPTVMSDTATASYYRQLVQINQQMVAQGVTTSS